MGRIQKYAGEEEPLFLRGKKKLHLMVTNFPVKVRPINPDKIAEESALLKKEGIAGVLNYKFFPDTYFAGKANAVVAEADIRGKPTVVGVYTYLIDKNSKTIGPGQMYLHEGFRNQLLGTAMVTVRDAHHPGWKVVENVTTPPSKVMFSRLGYKQKTLRDFTHEIPAPKEKSKQQPKTSWKDLRKQPAKKPSAFLHFLGKAFSRWRLTKK